MTDQSLGQTTDLVLDVLGQDPLGALRRQALVGLDDDERALLRAVGPALAADWATVVDAALDHARAFPELAPHVGADRCDIHLRAGLIAHLRELTSGDYDEVWLADRIRVGLQTADQTFPADWLASAWSWELSGVVPALRRATNGDAGRFDAALRALVKVAFLDLGMTLHARACLERQAAAGLQQFARTVLESVPDGIVLTDAEGRIVRFNGAAEAIFGIDRQAVSGRHFAERLHEANRAEEEVLRRELFGGRANGPLGPTDAQATAFQMTGLRADGTTLPIEVSFRVGVLDGQPICCAAVRDVSERVRAEQALRRSEANFRALIEGSPDAIVVHRDGLIVYANPSFLRLLDLPDLRAIAGHPVAEFLGTTERLLLEAGPDRSPDRFDGGSAREVRFVRGDREIVTEAREFALDFDAQPSIVVVARDMTERHRLLARMFEMDRAIAVGNLAAAASHDINNPLTYILGNTQFARIEARRLAGRVRAEDRTLSPAELADQLEELARALDEAQEGAVRVRETVASLRGFVRPDDTVGAPVRLDAVIDDAVGVAWNEIRHRARLEREYLAVRTVNGSEQRLCQAFVHLLLNAAQAIPEGDTEANEIRVTIESEGENVVVQMMDTGRGMAPEILGRAFEPFFTTHRVGEAAGLGLTIARQIVQAAGGTLSLQSEPGSGTTVRVRLPAAGEVDRLSAITGSLAPEVPPSRILVIDDEPSVAGAFRRVVDERHAVTTFTSARDALARLRAGERWDVVFCDLHMPDITGMQFHEALAALSPELAARTVFLTGGAFTEEARGFLRSVPNPCLDKPFDALRIARILGAVLGPT